MSNSTKRKIQGLVLVVLILISLMSLMAGIETIEFKKGYSLDFFDFQFSSPLPGVQAKEVLFSTILHGTSFLLILLLVYLVMVPRLWKKILKMAINLISLYILLYFFIHNSDFLWNSSSTSPGEVGADEADSVQAIPLHFEPSDTLVFLISFVLVLSIMAILYKMAIKTKRTEGGPPLEDLGLKAQEALKGIQAGGDLKNTIIRCYAEMSNVLLKNQNIQRDEMMTPREFEQSLMQYALPQKPIQELTRLFEKVRYGKKEIGEPEEKKCRECLSVIVASCQEKNEQAQ